jgi:hypothetical protein
MCWDVGLCSTLHWLVGDGWRTNAIVENRITLGGKVLMTILCQTSQGFVPTVARS